MLRRVVALLLGSMLALPALAQQPAPPAREGAVGEVMMVMGRASALERNGRVRVLAKGDPVYVGDLLSSGLSTFLNVRMSDGSFLLLRPDSRVQVSQYDYPKTSVPAPAPTRMEQLQSLAEPHALLSLLKGGLRAVSGGIAKMNRDRYQIQTFSVTVGVRGTDFLVVQCDETCASDPVVRDSLPEGASAAGGVVTGVIEGGISVISPGSTGNLEQGQFGLTLANGSFTQLPAQPHFLLADPMPNPRACID